MTAAHDTDARPTATDLDGPVAPDEPAAVPAYPPGHRATGHADVRAGYEQSVTPAGPTGRGCGARTSRRPVSSGTGAVRRIATVGVHGSTADAFLTALAGAGVGLLLDLRQRRGVRGPEHSWANSLRLQHALATAGVGYRHIKELAPTTELRALQYREDDRQGVGKRTRVALAPEYAERYRREILDPFDLGALVAGLPDDATTALLCVERDPAACHRSLVALRLRAEHGLPVTDLRPG